MATYSPSCATNNPAQGMNMANSIANLRLKAKEYSLNHVPTVNWSGQQGCQRLLSENNPDVPTKPAPYYWLNCCFQSSYMCFTRIHPEKEATENFFKVQSFPKPMIYISLSCSWHVGKFTFGKHKMETFSVHTHCGSMSGHPVWRPWLTIACFLETVSDHRDLMTSVESIFYNLVDIWEVFRISPWFLLGTHNYALRPQIGIWTFWLFGIGWNLASLLPFSKIPPHCFQFKTCRGYLLILAYTEI